VASRWRDEGAEATSAKPRGREKRQQTVRTEQSPQQQQEEEAAQGKADEANGTSPAIERQKTASQSIQQRTAYDEGNNNTTRPMSPSTIAATTGRLRRL
jgi:hypothetical protein